MSSSAFEPAAQQGARRLSTDPAIPDSAASQVAALATYAPQEARLTLAALLEASGVTDEVALSKGAFNVFDLADRQLATLRPAPAPPAVEPPAPPAQAWLPQLLIGPAQAAVMALAVAILGAVQVGLVGMGAHARAMTYGAIAAAVVSGAALQLSAWLIAVALGRGQALALRRALRAGLLVGAAALAAAVLVGGGAGALAGAPHRQVLAFTAVLVLIGPLLLAAGSLIILRRRAQAVLTLALGAAAAGAAAAALSSPAGQLAATGAVALAVAAALAAQAELEVRRRGRALEARLAALPSAGLVAYHVAPLAWYGALTVALVFASQPQVWAAGPGLSAGGALATTHLAGLAVLVLAQGAFELGMAGIWTTAIQLQRRLPAAEARRSGAGLWRFLLRTMARALILQLALAALIGTGAALIFAPSPALALSLAGYALLGHALFLCGVLNTLGHGWKVVQGLLGATLTAGAAALLAAAALGPQFEIVGVLAGAIVLLGVAGSALRGLLRHGDYALYRAFA